MLAPIDRRTCSIFGGYAAAFVLVAIANVLDLPPLVRFAAAVLALAGGAVAVSEATERLAQRVSARPRPASSSRSWATCRSCSSRSSRCRPGCVEVVAAALVGSVLGQRAVRARARARSSAASGTASCTSRRRRTASTRRSCSSGSAALTIPFLATQPGAPDFGHAAGAVGVRGDRPADRVRHLRPDLAAPVQEARPGRDARRPVAGRRGRAAPRPTSRSARPSRSSAARRRRRRSSPTGSSRPSSRRWRRSA